MTKQSLVSMLPFLKASGFWKGAGVGVGLLSDAGLRAGSMPGDRPSSSPLEPCSESCQLDPQRSSWPLVSSSLPPWGGLPLRPRTQATPPRRPAAFTVRPVPVQVGRGPPGTHLEPLTPRSQRSLPLRLSRVSRPSAALAGPVPHPVPSFLTSAHAAVLWFFLRSSCPVPGLCLKSIFSRSLTWPPCGSFLLFFLSLLCP